MTECLLPPKYSMKKKLSESEKLNAQEIDRIIGMAWEDRTPFEAIYTQFGLSEQEVIVLMRRHHRH